MEILFWEVLWLLFACFGTLPRLSCCFEGGWHGAEELRYCTLYRTDYTIFSYSMGLQVTAVWKRNRRETKVSTWGIRVVPGLAADAIIRTASPWWIVLLLFIRIGLERPHHALPLLPFINGKMDASTSFSLIALTLYTPSKPTRSTSYVTWNHFAVWHTYGDDTFTVV